MHPAGVLDHADEDFLARVAVARVAQHDRCPQVEIEGAGHFALAVGASSRETVDGHDERDPAMLEVVDGREAVFEPPGVGEHNRAEGPWDSSSQRNQNRSCPGVPKRYSERPDRMVMRPKSMATVVVVF